MRQILLINDYRAEREFALWTEYEFDNRRLALGIAGICSTVHLAFFFKSASISRTWKRFGTLFDSVGDHPIFKRPVSRTSRSKFQFHGGGDVAVPIVVRGSNSGEKASANPGAIQTSKGDFVIQIIILNRRLS